MDHSKTDVAEHGLSSLQAWCLIIRMTWN